MRIILHCCSGHYLRYTVPMIGNETEQSALPIASLDAEAIPGELFFTLEYDTKKACFIRKLPPGAEESGGGKFLVEGKVFVLPQGTSEAKILEHEEIRGRELLALARRGYNPLIRTGPVMAEREDRLMELGLYESPGLLNNNTPEKNRSVHSRSAEVVIVLRTGSVPERLWLPLEGLPNHRLYQNRIYEIIPPEIAALFTLKPGIPFPSLRLKGLEIPAFADDYARLLYVFADAALYGILGLDAVFTAPEKLSLVLRCEPVITKGVGKPVSSPLVKYENRLFSAILLSRHYHQKYIPLKEKWLRRETLDRLGIGPLGRFISGESLEPFRLKAGDFIAGGGEALRLLSLSAYPGGLEPEAPDPLHPRPAFGWAPAGSEEDFFTAHLEFLRRWGISGGVICKREKAVSLLKIWLGNLVREMERQAEAAVSGKARELRVLVILPETVLNLNSFIESAALGGIRFSGYCLRDKADTLDPYEKGIVWDILIVMGFEEIKNMRLLTSLKKISSRLKLGVFYDAHCRGTIRRLANDPYSEEIKNLFIKSDLKKYERLLIRQAHDFCELPEPPHSLPQLFQRPPDPWQGTKPPKGLADFLNPDGYYTLGGGRFLTSVKFQNTSAAGFKEEQAEFSIGGKTETAVEPAPFVRAEGRRTYQGLSETEKAYFLFWRSELRRGRIRETCPAYLLLYIRELLLLTGGGHPENSASLAVEELCRLFASYRELFSETESIPRWVLEFMIVNHVTGTGDLLFGIVADNMSRTPFKTQDSPLFDLYLHWKYVEENNSLDARDFLPILRKRGFGKNSEPVDGPLAKIGEALNAADRAVRTNYGKKLLELFYPLPPQKSDFVSYTSLLDMGLSVYSGEWLSYSRHKPFIDFLSSLAAFLEFPFFQAASASREKKPPPLDPVWRYLCGLTRTLPPELEPLFSGRERPSVALETETISRLREESDAVRELLMVEKEETPEENAPRETPALPLTTPEFSWKDAPAVAKDDTQRDMVSFINKLDEVSLGCLELLSEGKEKELDNYSRARGTMTELLIDEINRVFLNDYEDILIDSLDEGHGILKEYKDEVIWALTSRNA